jgi:16S rRNA (guanine966-N2)-methyltransferase
MYKKKKLISVPGMDTRPTADRLRETLFNILAFKVRDAVVLDLFAGTGALGLEALSRGAASCVFVDSSRKAVDVIRKNCESCPTLTPLTSVFCRDATKNLSFIEKINSKFTLVFADPPYGKNMIPLALKALSKAENLSDGALVVAEHGMDDDVDPNVPEFTVTDLRHYGKTAVTFFTYTKPADTEPN